MPIDFLFLARNLCVSFIHNNLQAWTVLFLHNVVFISLEESFVRKPFASPVVNIKAANNVLLVFIGLHLHLLAGGYVGAVVIYVWLGWSRFFLFDFGPHRSSELICE